MSRLRSLPVWTKVAFVALLVVSVAPACDEGGEKLPARCSDTNGDGEVDPLPLDDLGSAGFPHVESPCLNGVGHAVSFIDRGGSSKTTAGSSTGGTASGGNPAGQGGADAGAGGS